MSGGYVKRIMREYNEKMNPSLKKKKKKPKDKSSKWTKLKKTIWWGMPYALFLQSKYWKEIKKEVLKRDGNKCIACGCEYNLQIHHETYKHHLREHSHLNELHTLCGNCHYQIHLCSDIT